MTKLSTFVLMKLLQMILRNDLKLGFFISGRPHQARDEVTRIKRRRKLKNDRINLKFGIWAQFGTTTTIPKSEVPTLPRKRQKNVSKN